MGDYEVERRAKLWAEALVKGEKRYEDAQKVVLDAGRKSFDALPYDQRQAVKDDSHNRFLFEHGKSTLKPAELAAVTDAATLFDEASQATMVAKLAPVAATSSTGSPASLRTLSTASRKLVTRFGASA